MNTPKEKRPPSSRPSVSNPAIAARKEAKIEFTASPGPGGQNVNKLATKAVLKWSVSSSAVLTDEKKESLFSNAALKNRINSRGELVLHESRSRSQLRNKELVLEKFSELIAAALRPKKRRKKTRQPQKAREARMEQKRVRAVKKERRRRPMDGAA